MHVFFFALSSLLFVNLFVAHLSVWALESSTPVYVLLNLLKFCCRLLLFLEHFSFSAIIILLYVQKEEPPPHMHGSAGFCGIWCFLHNFVVLFLHAILVVVLVFKFVASTGWQLHSGTFFLFCGWKEVQKC